jgi:small conductance mechanosensitive channel
MNPVTQFFDSEMWRTQVLPFGLRLLTALIILLVGLWLARRIAGGVRATVSKRGGDQVLASFLRNAVFIALTLMVVIGALDRAGLPTASLLAALGAAGLAIGLALQGSLGNLASGVLLVITRPFRAGDFVEVGGQGGTVERIDLLQTVLIAADNRVITVPNAQVMNQPIVNFTARGTRRMDLVFTIAHDSDVRGAIEAASAAIVAHAGVLREPPPQVQVTRVGELGIELTARPWVVAGDYANVQGDLLAELRAAFAQANIKLAVSALAQRGEA